MRIPREAVTPALRTAIERFVGDGRWFRPTEKSEPQAPDRARDLLNAHADLKDGLGYAIFATFAAGIMIGLLLLAGESLSLLLVPGLVAAGTLALARRVASLRPDAPAPTADFLVAALPRLDLGPVQRRYAQLLVAIYSGRANDPGGNGLALLRQLAEEETRLFVLGETIGSTPIEAASEIETLSAKLESARDPAAREALTQSLALAERRLPGAERATALRERLDAHASLLDQASRTATETILGRHAPDDGLETLRANVASLGEESLALERAIEEMRTL